MTKVKAKKGSTTQFIFDNLNATTDECIPWPFHRVWDGGGQARFEGKTYRASRLMCELAHGEPPTKKHEAAHSCGNGHLGCVNPNHLSWKTSKENCADRVVHSTAPVGERNGRAKLSPQDILDIREKYKQDDILLRDLSEEYDVTITTIHGIVKGRIWSHV